MYTELVKYAQENEFPPRKENNPNLASWYITQTNQLSIGKLRHDRIIKIKAVDFKGNANRNKWKIIYDKLVEFRKLNPNRWPQARRDRNYSDDEVKMGIWCQTLRSRYRSGDLEEYWFNKMLDIDFNFDGKSDNWEKYYDIIKNLVKDRTLISAEEIGNSAYSWILRHKNMYENKELSSYQMKKISELDLDRFLENWQQKFNKVASWVQENGRIPTKSTHKDYNSWLYSQRSRYKNGTLTGDQIAKLNSISFDLEGLGKEKNEEKWFEYFNQLKRFIEINNRYPGPTKEKDLYIWVQSQRAAKAGTLRNRKILSKERVDMLDSINFQWIGQGTLKQSWEDSFSEFIAYIKHNGLLALPSVINGDRNFLYTWWINQKTAFEKGELSKARVEAFKNVGIDLNSIKKISKKDGFTKWANRLYEIDEFIKKTGHFPKSGRDNTQDKLYQSLARTKRAFINNELSEKQLKLLKELDINLE